MYLTLSSGWTTGSVVVVTGSLGRGPQEPSLTRGFYARSLFGVHPEKLWAGKGQLLSQDWGRRW